MVSIWLKALLFVAGGVTAAAGAAYVTGVLDPWLGREPVVIAALPDTPAPDAPAQPQQAPPASAEVPLPADPETTDKQPRLTAPSFDLVRAEPDGSVLVAGKAPSQATVEVLIGDTVLARTQAGAEGDFVIVLDEPLPPGDYMLTLRATTPDDEVALSTETAIVSVPETDDGQVLVMVEEPGQPAELLTVPDAPEVAADPAPPVEEVAAADEPAGEEVAAAPEPAPEAAEEEVAAAPAPEEPETAAPDPAPVSSVVVEAVEIEGGTVFVAGYADPDRTVRVYANALHLGDAVASPGGRFLVEARRELPVGDYVIRADVLDENGSVLARAAVPFEREPGESIAAVAVAPEPEPEATEEEVAAAPEPEPAPEIVEEEVAAAPEPRPEPEAVEEEVAAAPEPEPAPEPDVEVAVAPPAAEEDDVEITAPPLQRVDGAVIIRRGDNLWRISRRVYGHGIRYSTIYLANQDQIRDPNRIWPGQVFTVPRQTAEGDEADMGAIAGQVVDPQQDGAAAQ